jgi:ribosomal protein L40E
VAGLLMGITDILITYPYRHSIFVSSLYSLAVLEIIGGIIFLIIGLVLIGKAKELLSKETLSSSTEQKIFCADCGAKLDDDATFCTYCGAKLE